jgi:UDP-N-acetylmuramyl tripeptide synthase
MWFYLVLAVAKLSAFAIRLIDKSRGTDFPGKLALRLDKNFCSNFTKIDFSRVIFVTGSNGKSTTTNLIHHIFSKAGYKTASNLKGSNMLNGVATVFILNTGFSGSPKADFFILEVDERSLPYVYESFPARHAVVTNVMQDQVHRNGEPDLVHSIFRSVFNSNMSLTLNNDEPRSKSYEDLAKSVAYFGVERNPASYKKTGILDVTMPCPKCRHKIDFEYMNVSNMGRFRCTSCGFSSEERSVECRSVDFAEESFRIGDTKYRMPYAAPVMLYNYAAAVAVAGRFGVSPSVCQNALESFVNVAGRMETLSYRGKQIHYIRMKQENPETLQGALDSIAQDKSDKVFVIGLCTLDERRPQWVPHYANTYYAYECNFKPLLASGIEKAICFSEYVCYDVANRLIYDGADMDKMLVINSDMPERVMEAIEKCSSENVYFITLMRVMDGFKKYIRANG